MNYCDNEIWLAAYLDKTLPEEDRLLYEMHLSRCQSCLAELIAAKAELDEIVAKESEPARERTGAPARSRARFFRPVPAAASISIAALVVLASVFLLLRHVPRGDRDVMEAQATVSGILAAADIGEMRLSGGPERPVTHSAVYRGPGETAGGPAGRTEKALKTLLETHPNDWRVYAMLGDLYVAINQVDRADNFYAQALDLNPENARLLNDRAVAAYRLGDFDSAHTRLAAALEADGGRLEALYNLAVLFHEKGDRRASRQYVDAYLLKDPLSPWAERAKALARE